MARIIRRVVANKKRGAALIAALQIITLILIGFFCFIGGTQQSPKAAAVTKVTGPAQEQTQTAQNQTDQTDQAQTETYQPITAKDLSAHEKSAVRKTAQFA